LYIRHRKPNRRCRSAIPLSPTVVIMPIKFTQPFGDLPEEPRTMLCCAPDAVAGSETPRPNRRGFSLCWCCLADRGGERFARHDDQEGLPVPGDGHPPNIHRPSTGPSTELKNTPGSRSCRGRPSSPRRRTSGTDNPHADFIHRVVLVSLPGSSARLARPRPCKSSSAVRSRSPSR
jgi:hypothetical protein